MVEICFANITSGRGRTSGQKLLQCCTALPYEYVKTRLESTVKVVAVREDRYAVLGRVANILNGAPRYETYTAPTPGVC